MSINLRYDNKNKALIGQLLFKKFPFKAGVEGAFVPLNDHIGIKLYFLKYSRNVAVRQQAKAFKHGIGPAVGDKFELYFLFGDEMHFMTRYILYGYITERAHDVGKVRPNKEFLKTLEKVLNTDRLDFENNWGNVGRIGTHVVAVDFGPITLGYTNDTSSST